jgi:predicted phage tail protein
MPYFVGKTILEKMNSITQNGREIRIVPVVMGSKRGGVLQTILGAVLVVVGAIGTFTVGQAGAVALGAIYHEMGAAMMAGGVMQMLSPQPPVSPASRCR